MSTYPPENDSPRPTPIYDRSVSNEAPDTDEAFDQALHGTGTPGGDTAAGSATGDGPGFGDESRTEAYPGVHVPSFSGGSAAGSPTPPPPVPPRASGATGDWTPGDSTSGGAGSASDKADAAKGAAQDVAGDAKQAGAHVTGVAKEQASNVASEAADHARQLYGEATQTVKGQAGQQQEKAANGLRTISEQLSSMADSSEDDGIAAKVVRDLSQRAGSVAGYLEGRDPGSLIGEVKSFAARKPGTFIAVAAGAGILAGRLTKALTTEIKHEHERDNGADGTGTGVAS